VFHTRLFRPLLTHSSAQGDISPFTRRQIWIGGIVSQSTSFSGHPNGLNRRSRSISAVGAVEDADPVSPRRDSRSDIRGVSSVTNHPHLDTGSKVVASAPSPCKIPLRAHQRKAVGFAQNALHFGVALGPRGNLDHGQSKLLSLQKPSRRVETLVILHFCGSASASTGMEAPPAAACLYSVE
jgi:hypothetical protein